MGNGMKKKTKIGTIRSFACLDASLHLYKRVSPSVGPFVGWLVGNKFFLNSEKEE